MQARQRHAFAGLAAEFADSRVSSIKKVSEEHLASQHSPLALTTNKAEYDAVEHQYDAPIQPELDVIK